MDQSEINGAQEPSGVWSEELERVPLKQRLKMVLASLRSSDVKSETELPLLPPNVGAEKMGNEHSGSQNLQSGCSSAEQMIETVSKEERHAEYAGELGELSNQENLSHKCMNSSRTVTAAATSEKTTGYPVTVKVECADIDSPSAVSVNGSSLAGIQAVNFESDMGNDFVDELDHVVLKERLRWLLTSMMLKENFSGTEGKRPGDQTHCGNKIHGNDKTMKPASSKSTVNSSCKNFQGNKSTYADSSKIQKNDTVYSSRKTGLNYESKRQKTLLSGDITNVQGSTQPGLAHIKIEPPNSFNVNTEGQMSFMDLVLVKSEAEVIGDLYEDELDHMLLRERMKLLSPRNDPNSNNFHNSERMSKLIHSSMGCKPVASEHSQPIKINRPRKRRKTATDSIETAMEEDAPGLLQVLMKKGVSVNEIKLYGEPESNDALDHSSTNDNFAELETVIGKLFSRRESFLKFGPLRCTKGEKTSYCLECLFSLVEQARYLQFRNWPVEWGWCRDLQSFIFVFERHNRIVLERPEYGYATYFFELADSLPIDWQIKRLVTAMKLTSCSRVTLLENKALMVGDDLTEGEARVLMEYGWVPNTGLGTMLNYYDRVVHDRRNVDTNEWRSKIGKLLMDGYNGGTIISADIPTKAIEYNGSNPMQIKLEQ